MRPFKIRYATPPAGIATLERFVPGQARPVALQAQPPFEPGDFVLMHSVSFLGRLVSLSQLLRYWKDERKYAWWNHAALIVGENGDIIEAVHDGVKRGNLSSKCKNTPCKVVHIDPSLASAQDRQEAVAYANWAEGQKYGILTLISIALCLLFRGKLSFFIDGQSTCSGLVARALERTKIIFPRSPSHIMPADLASHFKVDPLQDRHPGVRSRTDHEEEHYTG